MSETNSKLVRVTDVAKTFHRGSEEIHVLSGLSLDVPRTRNDLTGPLYTQFKAPAVRLN